MSAVEEQVMKHFASGLHCSQVMMQLSLDLREIEEEFTIRALGGFGGGMCSQKTCGTLTGAVAMLSSYYPREAGAPEPTGYKKPTEELVTWFSSEYGSVDCSDIIENDRNNIMLKCPGMMAATFEKCIEILQEEGVDPYG